MPQFKIAYKEFTSEEISDLVEGTDFATVDVKDSEDSDDEEDCEAGFMDNEEIVLRMVNTLTSRVLLYWKKRRPKFSHDYAHVGCLLSPNPSIQHTVKTTTTQADSEACERLIFKLLIPPNVLGNDKTELKAQLMKNWNHELKLFQNHQGMFAKDYIWELAKVR